MFVAACLVAAVAAAPPAQARPRAREAGVILGIWDSGFANRGRADRIANRESRIQVEELGEIETPILLTSTLNVPRVADALLDYMQTNFGGTRGGRSAARPGPAAARA